MPRQKVALFPPHINPNELESEKLQGEICRKLKLNPHLIGRMRIDRISLDARWDHMEWRAAVTIWDTDEIEEESDEAVDVSTTEQSKSEDSPAAQAKSVIVIGSGPAGMFCALDLLREGFKVTLLERGKPVQERRRDIAQLNRGAEADPESNYCFGEGGAGTYSDGKLYTRSGDREQIQPVLEELVNHGAPENILWSWRPHIGSNLLPKVVQSICQDILNHPLGEVRFGARVDQILTDADPATPATDDADTATQPVTKGVRLADGSEILADAVVLATGHSSLDALKMARDAGAKLQAKGFAMGVRVEHPQQWLDKHQYHGHEATPKLPPSFYELRTQVNERGVYSFCMCPGGWIVPSQAEPGTLVVNGMSLSKRDSDYANSGIVVEIQPKDWCGKRGWRWGWHELLQLAADVSDHPMLHEVVTDPRTDLTIDVAAGRLPVHPDIDPLFGVRLQIALEVVTARAGGGQNRAPSQICQDFVDGFRHSGKPLPTSYLPGLVSADYREFFPKGLGMRLREGLAAFDQQIPGFAGTSGQIIGAETRTSSPVRVERNTHYEDRPLQSPTLNGFYPCGEGAGYAGGIVSAAIDGKRVAAAIAGKVSSAPVADAD
jgi:uncharacterized protein